MPAQAKPENAKILLYDERPAANGSLLPALNGSFANTGIDIETVGRAALPEKLTTASPLAFVLPGIIGMDSPYHEHLEPDTIDKLHEKIEDGMVGIFICAGAAFFSRETKYDPPWGASKRRTQLRPLFNGVAKGPIRDLAREPEDDIGDITLAPVSYENADGDTRKASIYYGNGTYFLPDDENDPNIKVVARFDEVEGTPPAIVRVQKGKGFCYFMAVHPEIGPVELSQDPNVQSLDKLNKLNDALKLHENGRQELWGMIMQDILNHHAKITSTPNPGNDQDNRPRPRP